MQKAGEALSVYRQALIENPGDVDAKFNYELVKKLIEEQKNQQEQKSQDKKNQDQKDKQNKDQQDQKNQDKNEKNKDKQNQQKKKQDKQNKQKQKKKKIDPKQAESMLKALREKEKDLLKQIIKAQKAKSSKTKKDW